MEAPVRPGWLIELESKKRVAVLATRLKVSESFFVDQMINHLATDDRGIPAWWPTPVPLDDGELPIDSA